MNTNKRIGPFIKDVDTVSKLMHRYLFGLLPIIVFTFFKHGIIPYLNGETNLIGILYPILFMLTGAMSTIVTEEVFLIVFKKLKDADLIDTIKKSYSYLPGLILSLIVPIDTPLAILFIGGIFASFIGKMIYGGFANNYFNPPVLGSVFILTTYNVLFNDTYDTYLNIIFIILVSISLIYLIVSKTIKWRISIPYILTFTIMELLLTNSFSNTIIPLSSVLFIGTFLMDTPVVTNKGSILYGITLAILSFIMKIYMGYIGLLIPILILDIFAFLFDKIGVRIEFDKRYYLYFIIVIMIALAVPITMHNANISEVTYDYIY